MNVGTVRAFALSIVDGPSLQAKLRAPPRHLVDADGGPALVRAQPARDGTIALAARGKKLPGLGALRDPSARAACLSRFAHHELCAVELFAWALLAFPSLPAALRRAFVHTLAEEQVHCRMYLKRLATLGVAFGSLPLSEYFWKHTQAIATAGDRRPPDGAPARAAAGHEPSPLARGAGASLHGPLAFLCAMGLTLEQANLDFTLMYRDAFRAAGDEESARVLQRVHDDEIGHVKLAATWVKKLTGANDVDAYRAHAPFPFALARAKGRRLDVQSRESAGLSRALIDAVQDARPYG